MENSFYCILSEWKEFCVYWKSIRTWTWTRRCFSHFGLRGVVSPSLVRQWEDFMISKLLVVFLLWWDFNPTFVPQNNYLVVATTCKYLDEKSRFTVKVRCFVRLRSSWRKRIRSWMDEIFAWFPYTMQSWEVWLLGVETISALIICFSKL